MTAPSHTKPGSLPTVVLVCCALAFTLAACGDDERPASTAGPTATATATATADEPGRRNTLRIYVLDGEKVAPVAREVPATPRVGAAAIRALLAGPAADERSAGLTTAIPAGTRLLDLDISGGTADVDLSGEFASGGGSLSMTSRVAQVVTTLTAFPSVRRVAFRIDGRPVTTVGGEGVPVAPPRTRADIEDSLPQILVETPLRGDRVGSPLHVSGSSNTFEATSVIEILDASGRRLARETVTATSGNGERGTFEATISFDQPPSGQRLTLYSYASSAEDGRPLHEVRIPLSAL